MKKILPIILLIAYLFLGATLTFATDGSGGTPDGSGGTPGTGSVDIQITNPLECTPDPGHSQLECLLGGILGKLRILAIPVVALMVLVGGFQILFAAGNPEKIKTGGKTILYAAIGYAVILLADGITLIIQDLLSHN